MPRKILLLRALAFFVVLAIAIVCVDGFFGMDSSRNLRNWVGLSREKRGGVDAIYLGASNVLEFWQPLYGWAEHGMAVRNLSVNDLTCTAFKNMIIEARKTQPDALYIISLSNFKGNGLQKDFSYLHRAVDYMPFSLNKLSMIHYLVSRSEYRGLDALEFYLPIIRFHSRWDDLKKWVFNTADPSTPMPMTDDTYSRKVRDISNGLVLDGDVKEPIPEDVGEVLEDLLDYFDSQHVKALFVKSPQKLKIAHQAHMNAIEDILEARGYPCLDLMDDFYEIGLDPRMDFHNNRHVNIHGAVKFCGALSDYLVENYHFGDKRGLPGWENWDTSAQAFMEGVTMYTLPFEREHAPRFLSDIPGLKKPSVDGQSVNITWKGIEGAGGYAVYRKTADEQPIREAWACVAEVDAGISDYTDAGLNPSTEYVYTVVPWRMNGEAREYGSFNVLGVNASTKGESA